MANIIDVSLFHPRYIFNGHDNTIAARSNAELTKSFYHSRTGNRSGKECTTTVHHRIVVNNAGAVQLYQKNDDGKYEIYYINGNKNKEYHWISFRNELASRNPPYFELNSYSHVERLLMRDILDDLLMTRNSTDPKRPSDYPEETANDNELAILQNLAKEDVQGKYKTYLEEKQLIVKMWSERPPCDYDYIEGGPCSKFIQNIFPEGSQYGHIVEDTRGLSEARVRQVVEDAWRDFEIAYDEH